MLIGENNQESYDTISRLLHRIIKSNKIKLFLMTIILLLIKHFLASFC